MRTIRGFRLSDLPVVMRIERASFRSEGYSAATFLAYAFRDRKGFFVAEDDSHQVIGYVLARKSPSWLGPRRGGITSIAVAAAQRRQGIGRALMHTALAYLKAHRAREADLEVSVSNRAAQSLYEMLGFRQAKLLPNYYGQNRDGLRMIVDLAQVEVASNGLSRGGG